MTAAPYLPGMESEARSRELSQFYTPPELADLVARWALASGPEPKTVLEPAAGQGALVVALFRARCGVPYGHLVAYHGRPTSPEVTVCDIDEANTVALRRLQGGYPIAVIEEADYLNVDFKGERFDLGLMNPPFENGKAGEFILATTAVCDRVVSILPAAIVYGAKRWREVWRHVAITRGVWLSERWQFGGEHSPMTDFCVLEMVRRPKPLEKREPFRLEMEWW